MMDRRLKGWNSERDVVKDASDARCLFRVVNPGCVEVDCGACMFNEYAQRRVEF